MRISKVEIVLVVAIISVFCSCSPKIHNIGITGDLKNTNLPPLMYSRTKEEVLRGIRELRMASPEDSAIFYAKGYFDDKRTHYFIIFESDLRVILATGGESGLKFKGTYSVSEDGIISIVLPELTEEWPPMKICLSWLDDGQVFLDIDEREEQLNSLWSSEIEWPFRVMWSDMNIH